MYVLVHLCRAIDVREMDTFSYKNKRFSETKLKSKQNILKKMQGIKILLISISINVALMDKPQINGKTLSSKNCVSKPIRLRSFTPLKNLRLLEKSSEVEQELREEKLAEEMRRKIAKALEEQAEKNRLVKNYLNSHRLGSLSFWNDFHTNRLF